MKKGKLFLGLTGVLTFITATLVSLTVLAEDHKMLVNDALDLTNQAVTGFTGGDYELTDEGCYQLIEDSMRYCAEQEEEGSVLLYNDGALPLKSTERKVSLFGKNSTNPIYRSGAGGPIANYEYQVDFHKAFVDGGFQLNETLYDGYKNYNRRADGSNIARSANEVGEADEAFYTSEIKNSFGAYKDVAIVVLARYGSEGSDLTLNSTVNHQHLLELDKFEKDMIKVIKAAGFQKIVVLLNGCMPVELDWIKDPETSVNAVLWIGNPGYYGLPGVVNVLTGAANPSGRTMETYAADSTSAPAMQNFGDHNMDTSDMAAGSVKNDSAKMIAYAEGIYVGYKYYETRYEDVILNQGNASSSNGCFKSTTTWDYAKEVCYPFGYGLSYSTFDYKLNGVTFDSKKDIFTANVTVTNTSAVDGKAVIELYGQAPYTQYDRDNRVEKASVQLLNYKKVAVKAGQSITTTVEADRYFLASYDAKNAKQYIFEPGDYYFAVGANGSHDAINAILAQKGKTGLTDHNGVAVDLDKAKALAVKYVPEITTIDLESYKYSRYNQDQKVTNLFDDCDLNYWADEEDKMTYLTRNDWAATWPKTIENVHVNARMEAALKMNNYVKPADATAPVDGVDYNVKLEKKILFADMKGVPYDDPKWDAFISQLDLDELAISVSDYRGIQSIVKIQKPANSVAEGPEGMLATFKYGDKRHTTGFATLPLVASTWDHEMQYKHGTQYGNEALFAGVAMVNGPGTNLVRTPYLGRTSEYFSEDGVLNYYTAGHVVGGMLEKGCIGNIKHCFMNNQETNRQKVSTFAEEQCMRELYARGWEGAFTYGKGMGVMTAYNRIGLTYTASSIALNQKLFRDEWNFQGSIIDDAMSQSDYSNLGDMLEAGTNLFCLDGNRGTQIVNQIRNTEDGHLLDLLQRANKRLMYALTFSFMGGETANVSGGLEWWESTIIAVDCVFGAATLAAAGAFVFFTYLKKKED